MICRHFRWFGWTKIFVLSISFAEENEEQYSGDNAND